MGKDDELIMVVKRNILFPGDSKFDGFMPAGTIDFENLILNNHEYIPRGQAENNPALKQPIGYVTIVNPYSRSLFVYQRAKKDEQYKERRLQGKWSWGVGGHIDQSDSWKKNPIKDSLQRELMEEVALQPEEIIGLKVLGYINDDSNSVGQVHFGILYVAETVKSYLRGRGEMDSGKFMGFGQLEDLVRPRKEWRLSDKVRFFFGLKPMPPEVETWSQISLEPLRKHFSEMKPGYTLG